MICQVRKLLKVRVRFYKTIYKVPSGVFFDKGGSYISRKAHLLFIYY